MNRGERQNINERAIQRRVRRLGPVWGLGDEDEHLHFKKYPNACGNGRYCICHTYKWRGQHASKIRFSEKRKAGWKTRNRERIPYEQN